MRKGDVSVTATEVEEVAYSIQKIETKTVQELVEVTIINVDTESKQYFQRRRNVVPVDEKCYNRLRGLLCGRGVFRVAVGVREFNPLKRA